jgi:hypothetical protein
MEKTRQIKSEEIIGPLHCYGVLHGLHANRCDIDSLKLAGSDS